MNDTKAKRMVCQTFEEWKREGKHGNNFNIDSKKDDIKSSIREIESLKQKIQTQKKLIAESKAWLKNNKKPDVTAEKYTQWVSKVKADADKQGLPMVFGVDKYFFGVDKYFNNKEDE